MMPPMRWPSRFATCTPPDRRACLSRRFVAEPPPAGGTTGPYERGPSPREGPGTRDQMIAWLRGRILDKQPNRIIVDAGGVGYDVAVPLSTFYGLGDSGADIELRIHTHVREDA